MEINLSIECYIERDQKYVVITTDLGSVNFKFDTLDELGNIVKEFVEDEFDGWDEDEENEEKED